MDYSASARDYGYRDFSLGPGYFFIEYGNFPDSGSYGDGNRYVLIQDSRIVYLITDEICNNILNIEE